MSEIARLPPIERERERETEQTEIMVYTVERFTEEAHIQRDIQRVERENVEIGEAQRKTDKETGRDRRVL